MTQCCLLLGPIAEFEAGTSRSGFVVVALIVAVLLTPLFAQQEAPPKVGIFATLPSYPSPTQFLEVGHDFVVAKDFTGLNDTRIPITSVKAVVHFKGFERR